MLLLPKTITAFDILGLGLDILVVVTRLPFLSSVKITSLGNDALEKSYRSDMQLKYHQRQKVLFHPPGTTNIFAA